MNDVWLALLLVGIVFAIGLWLGYLIWRRKRDIVGDIDELDNDSQGSDREPYAVQHWHDNAGASSNNAPLPPLRTQNNVISAQTLAKLSGIQATRSGSSSPDANQSPTPREFKSYLGPLSRSPGSVGDFGPNPDGDNQDNKQQLILSVLLLPKPGQSLDGSLLIAAMEAQGMHLGKMQIYHCYDRSTDIGGTLLFSAALTIEPGTMNPADIEEVSIPGVVLFMRLPGLTAPEVALQAMIRTARLIADRINAVVCDDRGSSLSIQSVNYMRECIGEFSRCQLLL